MALVLINCEGDIDLAKRFCDFLVSTHPTITNMISLNEAEIMIQGKTPAEVAGIRIEDKNRWITVIQNASKLNN
jgi:hypothetical protein